MPQEIFRLTSAGSVDDGKSTILARLLLDTGSVFEDQLGGIDPRRVTATTVADLLDGLESERQQGITIDVAHRFFDSKTRRYHIADSPGHEQYTKNMATAASHADALLLVVEATSGVKPQTLRHLRIAALLGIRHVIVAINKMDLVRHSQKTFVKIREEVQETLSNLAFTSVALIPVSGLTGANVVARGRDMKWWEGPTILEALDGLELEATSPRETVCVVQDVRRIPGGGRRYLASLVSGEAKLGGRLRKAGQPGDLTIKALSRHGVPVEVAQTPAEVSLEIDTAIDLERGDVLTQGETVELTDHLEANVVWLDAAPGHPGRRVECRLGHASVSAEITRAWTLEETLSEKQGAVCTIPENSIVRANIKLSREAPFSPFSELRELGRLVLVDPTQGNTLAAGTVIHGLRRAKNITPFDFAVHSQDGEQIASRTSRVVWFTGLSGSGKSTIANEVSKELNRNGVPHAILDGDNLRTGLNMDLGFSEADRVENVRRTAEVAKLMADAGLVVLVSLISPYRADRANARRIIGGERFLEVFVDTPLEECERRDPKGLYQKARAGNLPSFTGISSPYEPPEKPEILIPGLGLVESGRDRVLWELLTG